MFMFNGTGKRIGRFVFQVSILLDGIKKAGGDIIAIINDGNKVNKKSFSLFDTVNKQSWLTKNIVILIFDYVHLLKNIINNWITEKTQKLEYVIDAMKKVANWSDIKRLYTLEANNLIKLSKLTEVSFIPKPNERQKFSTWLQVLNDATVTELKVMKISYFSNSSVIAGIY